MFYSLSESANKSVDFALSENEISIETDGSPIEVESTVLLACFVCFTQKVLNTQGVFL